MGTKFTNAKKMSVEYPDSFRRPDEKALNEISIGDIVKVSAGERFWTCVIHRDGNTLKAIIDNELIETSTHGYKYGDEITFNIDDVYDIFVEEGFVNN